LKWLTVITGLGTPSAYRAEEDSIRVCGTGENRATADPINGKKPRTEMNNINHSQGVNDLVAPAGNQTAEKVGRDDPCPCGSGRKYKKCHGLGQGVAARNSGRMGITTWKTFTPPTKRELTDDLFEGEPITQFNLDTAGSTIKDGNKHLDESFRVDGGNDAIIVQDNEESDSGTVIAINSPNATMEHFMLILYHNGEMAKLTRGYVYKVKLDSNLDPVELLEILAYRVVSRKHYIGTVKLHLSKEKLTEWIKQHRAALRKKEACVTSLVSSPAPKG
jgi:hypothetical protein